MLVFIHGHSFWHIKWNVIDPPFMMWWNFLRWNRLIVKSFLNSVEFIMSNFIAVLIFGILWKHELNEWNTLCFLLYNFNSGRVFVWIWMIHYEKSIGMSINGYDGISVLIIVGHMSVVFPMSWFSVGSWIDMGTIICLKLYSIKRYITAFMICFCRGRLWMSWNRGNFTWKFSYVQWHI